MNELTELARHLLAQKSIVPHRGLPDKAESLSSVLGMSVCDTEDSSNRRRGATDADAMVPPLSPGWLVVYRGADGLLCGGADDRDNGTMAACVWERGAWTVRLTNGMALPLSVITAVGQTDATGRLGVAWTVKEHGYDGSGRRV